MVVCENCGCKFDKRRDKKAFKDYFKGELEYDDVFSGRDLCCECAIDMMNGREEYDPDFVNKYL